MTDLLVLYIVENLLFPTMCCNINLLKLIGNYALFNTRSTAKNPRGSRDHNLSAWNQYYRPSCMSYSIESQSYFSTFSVDIRQLHLVDKS